MFSLWRRFVSRLAPPLLRRHSGGLSGRRGGSVITLPNTDHTQSEYYSYTSPLESLFALSYTQTHTLHSTSEHVEFWEFCHHLHPE